jgi:hypothetical protein
MLAGGMVNHRPFPWKVNDFFPGSRRTGRNTLSGETVQGIFDIFVDLWTQTVIQCNYLI